MLFRACCDAASAARCHRLELVATLPGEPLYLALGFDRLDEVVVPLPGGLEMRGWRMGRSLDGPQSPC